MAAGASWCTLCYAAVNGTESPRPAAPAPAPLAPAPLVPAPVLHAVAVPAPAAASTATLLAPSWPCTMCGETVGIDLMACPSCATPFMGGVTADVALNLPGVGNVAALSPGARFAFMAGGAIAFSLVLVLVFLVLGHIV
jgi:hypothetical protein